MSQIEILTDVQTGAVTTRPLTLEQIAALESYVPPLAVQQRARQAAYTAEADPLFFKWQAGEATEAAWKAKRAEIRARYPYPSDT
jgi:hypothetical protein